MPPLKIQRNRINNSVWVVGLLSEAVDGFEYLPGQLGEIESIFLFNDVLDPGGSELFTVFSLALQHAVGGDYKQISRGA
jgi:hypothetical protein